MVLTPAKKKNDIKLHIVIMSESEELETVLNENKIHKHHQSVINHSLCQYKITTQSSSNIASLLTLDAVWNENNKNLDSILNAISTNSDDSKTLTWSSSLRNHIDPVTLYKKSSPDFSECCKRKYKGLDEFEVKKCSCALDLREPNNHKQEEVNDRKQMLNPQNNDNQSISAEEQQRIKPKFSRAKPLRTPNQQPVINSTTTQIKIDLDSDEELKQHKSNVAKITFKTAKEQLLASNPAAKRTLGASRKAQAKFVSPMIGTQDKQEQQAIVTEMTDDRLKHIDPKMIELIESEIIYKGSPVGWDDIAGLQMAKSVIQEAVVWPLLRPDIFTGLRRPPKGILLFGPPGTGKTLIGKCVAAQCNATFFSISASSLTSKWVGDGEKMVRALFAVARCHQPAVVFIDEIDSLLAQRSDSEHEATRRIKTEFLVQFDGAATEEEDRILIVGATNRPQELDEAARRRLVKRLYIPLPDADARKQIISNLLRDEKHELSEEEAGEVARLCAGHSGADVRSLCAEAAMGPVRCVPLDRIAAIAREQVRPVNMQDFKNALQRVRPSVSESDLGEYVKWNETYGHGF